MGFAEFNYSHNGTRFQSSRVWQSLGNGSYVRTVNNFTDNLGNNLGTISSYVYGVGTNNLWISGQATSPTTPRGPTISRRIDVVLKGRIQFPAAMVAKGGINMNGNNVTTDSFDSTDPSKSTSHQYDPAKRQSNGDVATVDAITNSVIGVGNANIYGKALTGPSGSVTMGPNGSIGPLVNPYTSVAAATAAGYVRNDFQVDIPDATLPSGASSWPSVGSLGSATLASGTYKATDITSNNSHDTLVINGNVMIYVTGSVNVKGQITVNPNCSLTIYSAGNMSIGGNGVVNNSTSDFNVTFYGLPTCTSFTLHGNANWSGTVYAPEAAFSLSGGGNSGEFSGAVVGSSITMNGHVQFHYDEALCQLYSNNGYNLASWKSYRYDSTGGTWVSD
jgi:hypothetical protein